MDSSLYCRRQLKPRSKIEAGSVGIAGNQTGIYPSTSPGGWQIIGKTPVKLFDKEKHPSPSLCSAGDSIRFESISKDEFDYLKSHPEDIKM
jgi:KipI family sensor histidine kinase inhibitor